MQRHPIRHTVDHVDFLLIRRDQAITVEVPIILEGDAEQVTREQGMIEHLMQVLTIKAKPGSIPDQLTYDISGLNVGDTVTVTRTNRDYLGTVRAIGPDADGVNAALARFRAAHDWTIA